MDYYLKQVSSLCRLIFMVFWHELKPFSCWKNAEKCTHHSKRDWRKVKNTLFGVKHALKYANHLNCLWTVYVTYVDALKYTNFIWIVGSPVAQILAQRFCFYAVSWIIKHTHTHTQSWESCGNPMMFWLLGWLGWCNPIKGPHRSWMRARGKQRLERIQEQERWMRRITGGR